jgi:hypothetical protein
MAEEHRVPSLERRCDEIAAVVDVVPAENAWGVDLRLVTDLSCERGPLDLIGACHVEL